MAPNGCVGVIVLGEIVTIIRQGIPTGAYDSQQNPVLAADTEIVLSGWAVAPRGSAETAETYGQQTITGLTLYRRIPVDILPSDRFRVRGDVWTVDGDSGEWVSPFAGVLRGVVVNLKRQG